MEVARVDPDPKHTLMEEESAASGSTSKLSKDLETKLKVCQIFIIRKLKDSYGTSVSAALLTYLTCYSVKIEFPVV